MPFGFIPDSAFGFAGIPTSPSDCGADPIWHPIGCVLHETRIQLGGTRQQVRRVHRVYIERIREAFRDAGKNSTDPYWVLVSETANGNAVCCTP